MNDLTIIYLTANKIPLKFQQQTIYLLRKDREDIPFIALSREALPSLRPSDVNIIVDREPSHINIYRKALAGAKVAQTKYIAIAEDDVLYSPEHFKKRPRSDDAFAYNIACWSIYTWSKPAIYSYTGRRNFGQLICSRDLFIEAMEERFAKYPEDSMIDNALWAEPGKYEDHLGVTRRVSEQFYTDPANVMFTHPEGLSYHTLGEKKRLAPIRAYEIPYWGRAEKALTLYE